MILSGWGSRSVLAVCVASTLVGVRCGSGDLITFDKYSIGRTFTVPLGEEFEVALRTVGPNYFTTPVVSSDVVRFLRETVDAERSGQSSPGGGKTQRFRFKAVARGVAGITIPREMPGVGDFSMSVEVR